MPAVRLENLTCSFPGVPQAVSDVSLELHPGELFCLLGPSGCGKSTLLRLIGGYLRPDSGRISIGERDVTLQPPESRNTGMVFQNYALFPHLSALDNVAFGLRVKGVRKNERQARAHEMLDWVGLTPTERARRPAQLSGGQQQRVALARALAFRPSLLMLDEPFANLDRLLRERLREELKQVQRRSQTTTILVTHDREEALALGDRIGVMHRGHLLQVGTAEEVYRTPANPTVAQFLGHRNLFEIIRADESVVEAAGIRCPQPTDAARAGDSLLLWPNRIRLRREPCEHCFAATVKQSQFAGTHLVVTLELDSKIELEALQDLDREEIASGETAWIETLPGAISIVRKEPVG